MTWDCESEERLAPRLLPAVRSEDESERDTVPSTAMAMAVAASPQYWEDDSEGPVRGRLRRALLAVD